MVKPPAFGTFGTKTSSHCPGRDCDMLLAYATSVERSIGIYPYCVPTGDFKAIYANIVVDLIYSLEGNLV